MREIQLKKSLSRLYDHILLLMFCNTRSGTWLKTLAFLFN